MDNKKTSKFGVGLVIGAVAGAVTALFLSPKSGKENRELVAKKFQELKALLEEKEVDKKVKEIYGEVTEETKKLYASAKEQLVEKLALLKEAVQDIDKEKYMKIVNEVIDKVKNDPKHSGHSLGKLKDQLSSDWQKLVARKSE